MLLNNQLIVCQHLVDIVLQGCCCQEVLIIIWMLWKTILCGEFELAFRKSSSQILLALGKSWFVCFFYLVGNWFACALAHGASEIEKLLALQENLLVPDNRTAFFSSPALPKETCFQIILDSSNLPLKPLWQTGGVIVENRNVVRFFEQKIDFASRWLWEDYELYVVVVLTCHYL